MIAGLGNPGRVYEETPHNAGFVAVDSLCQSLGGTWRIEPRFKADVAKVTIEGEPVLLVKPLTFMNASGEAVGSLMRYFRMEPSQVTIISDDVNLLPGRIRVRETGSAGGHNGLKSIIEHLGTQTFARVRVGVGTNRTPLSGEGLVEYVLGHIAPEDARPIAEGATKAAEAARYIVREGTEKAMNRFNATAPKKTPTAEDKRTESNNTKHPPV